MKRSEGILYSIISIASLVAGGTFGLLDIFGFIDGRHTLSIQLLLLAALLVYVQVISTFFLNFIDKPVSRYFFAAQGIVFASVFVILNTSFQLALFSGIIYGLFLFYTHVQSHARSQLFIRFQPIEIFFPILKTSFTFFLIFLSLIAYFQSRSKILTNTLVSAEVIHVISKPSVYLVNRQLNGQLQSESSISILETLSPEVREKAIRTSLQQAVNTMADPKKKTVYGIPLESIDVSKADISDTGIVDIEPVLTDVYPHIAQLLNSHARSYLFFAPFLIALSVFLLMQTVILPLRGIEMVITRALFKTLRSLSIITITTVQKDVEQPHI